MKYDDREVFNRVQILSGLEILAEKQKKSIGEVVGNLFLESDKTLFTISDKELLVLIAEELKNI